VQKLISWKHSFRRLSEEYELAKKKKDALGNLLSTGKISQSTHSLFDREIEGAMAEIENQRKALLEKMASKMMELEEQIKTLEILVAKFEIQHVTGEVDEQIYQRETDLLSMGLETARQELDAVQEAVNQLSNSDVIMQQETETQTQGNGAPQPEVEFLEEPAPAAEKEPLEPAEETAVEKIEIAAEAQNSESEAKSEEKQET
jgi:hypothetical protein